MKKYSIGTKVSFFIEGSEYTGKVTDILEMGYEGNESNIYEVTTDLGVFNLDNNGKAIV